MTQSRRASIDRDEHATSAFNGFSCLGLSSKFCTKTEILGAIEKAIEDADKNFAEFKTAGDKFRAEPERLAALSNENSLIRYHLRTLNRLLDILLPLNAEDKLWRGKQLPATTLNVLIDSTPEMSLLLSQNYGKWLAYYRAEHQSYAKRTAQIGDPTYVPRLKSKCAELDAGIESLAGRARQRQQEERLYQYVFCDVNKTVENREIGQRSRVRRRSGP